MNCSTVSEVILQQAWSWALSIVSWVQQQCQTLTQQVQSWQQQWQNQCSNVAQQVQQWQQQWQNQCVQQTSQVCQSLPWPLSALCSWVTTLVCNLVSVMVSVIVTVIQLVCTVVSVLISVLITVIQLVCAIVTVIAMVLTLVIVLILRILLVVLCTIIPCRAPMENPMPPDGGWLVMLGGAAPSRLSQNNTVVGILPDGQLACASAVTAIGQATSSIHILELEFDANPDFIATFLNNTPFGPMQPGMTLIGALAAVNQNVAIRILLNTVLVDSVNALQQDLQKNFGANRNIEVRGIDVASFGPFGVMHAKALVVDGANAFVVGLPFSQGYWDTQHHFVTDARRGTGAGGNAPILGDVGNGVGDKPAHTASFQLSGPAAADVDATFISLWNSVAPSTDQVAPSAVPVGVGNQSIQIVRTAPRLKNASGLANGETGVLEAHLRAIGNARTFIYLEAQYLTSPVIGDALALALGANPRLQLILLINENPDMPTYKFWQNALLAQLGEFQSTQVGAFSLWRTQAPAAGQPLPEIMQCYVEAKVGVVDDVWASVGSGNLDGASLGHMFEFLPSPLSCASAAFGWRNMELNAILYDGIAGQPSTGEVAVLRKVLWREHLGIEEVPEDPPPGGWLQFWTAIAAANIISLNANQAMRGDTQSPSRILPYVPALDTVEQLTQLGINVSAFDVAPAVP